MRLKKLSFQGSHLRVRNTLNGGVTRTSSVFRQTPYSVTQNHNNGVGVSDQTPVYYWGSTVVDFEKVKNQTPIQQRVSLKSCRLQSAGNFSTFKKENIMIKLNHQTYEARKAQKMQCKQNKLKSQPIKP